VKLGRSLGDEREVTAGLSGGDEVVLDPPKDLADGARVRVAARKTEHCRRILFAKDAKEKRGEPGL
jgi:hypothetical protein